MSITVSFDVKEGPEMIHSFGQVSRRHVGRVFRDTEGALFLVVETEGAYAPMSLSGADLLYVKDEDYSHGVDYPLTEESPLEIKITPRAVREDDF